jgi:hypothetical protein
MIFGRFAGLGGAAASTKVDCDLWLHNRSGLRLEADLEGSTDRTDASLVLASFAGARTTLLTPGRTFTHVIVWFRRVCGRAGLTFDSEPRAKLQCLCALVIPAATEIDEVKVAPMVVARSMSGRRFESHVADGSDADEFKRREQREGNSQCVAHSRISSVRSDCGKKRVR